MTIREFAIMVKGMRRNAKHFDIICLNQNSMATSNLFTMEALGDHAVLLTCQDASTAQQLAASIQTSQWQGLENVVVAYHTLAIHIDTRIEPLSAWFSHLESLAPSPLHQEPRLHTIPCCYELGEDLDAAVKQLSITPEKLVELHTSTMFTIYAIGFSPGFPYLGWLPVELQGIARRKEPRLKVPTGSVAIVGKQSAIYPQSTPGGWALIGCTPVKIVDVVNGYFPLKVGDQVKFEAISRTQFEKYAVNPLR